MRLRLLVLSIALVVLPMPLMADTVYTYTGSSFTSFESSLYTTSDFVSGSLTFSAPLAANMSLVVVTPTFFSFSDGVNTLSSDTTPAVEVFDMFVATDASGNISQWFIALADENDGEGIGLQTGWFQGIANDLGYVNPPAELSMVGQNNNDPGTWTSASTDPSAVPEPSSLVLIGTGLVGVFGAVRRRVVG